MEFKKLNNRQEILTDDKLFKSYNQFVELLNELKKRELSEDLIKSVNLSVDKINSSTLKGKQLIKFIKKEQSSILKQIEKERKIVPKNYYRNLWLALGMSAFGLPIGVALGLSVGNIGLLAIGLPIGMAIGLAFGSSLDKKAFNEGRQLDIEIK
jgi:hypothetical protein